jgi:hypothetical protein
LKNSSGEALCRGDRCREDRSAIDKPLDFSTILRIVQFFMSGDNFANGTLDIVHQSSSSSEGREFNLKAVQLAREGAEAGNDRLGD